MNLAKPNVKVKDPVEFRTADGTERRIYRFDFRTESACRDSGHG